MPRECPIVQPVPYDPQRRRSIGYVEKDGETWSCFLVTYPGEAGRWRGYFAFRAQTLDEYEIRTADIFLEDDELQIDRRARGLGRPLLTGLLSSALDQHEREMTDLPQLRRWFRTMLQSNSRELAGAWEEEEAPRERSGAELRSMYASYRVDQVCHFITLVKPEDFEAAVEKILSGRAFDFGAKDQLQFAMMVVEFIESHLPLPPFEVWARDYVANPEAYRLYTHTLHRTGRLP